MGVNLMDDEPRGGGAVLPDGWHNVQVRMFKEGKSPNDNPYVEYCMGNTEGTIWRTFYITPKAKWILKNFVGCCGYTGDLRDFDFRAILNASVQVLVGLGEPNRNTGKRYREVIDFAPIGGIRKVPVNAVGNVVDDEESPL